MIGHVRSLATHCEASRNRLRPITMTTLAAIPDLVLLALANGEGSAMQHPLAVAIIAGLAPPFPDVGAGIVGAAVSDSPN